VNDRLRHPLNDAVRYGPVSGKINDARDSTHGKQPLVQSVTAKQPFISTSSAFPKQDRDPE
jgi:hypothetical protein